MRDADVNKLNEEYQRMVQGLKEARMKADTDMVLANPVLPKDILKGELPTFCINMLNRFNCQSPWPSRKETRLFVIRKKTSYLFCLENSQISPLFQNIDSNVRP